MKGGGYIQETDIDFEGKTTICIICAQYDTYFHIFSSFTHSYIIFEFFIGLTFSILLMILGSFTDLASRNRVCCGSF